MSDTDKKSKSDTIIMDIPRIGDNLITLSSKLIAISNVINTGQSVAIATAYSATPNQKPRSIQPEVDQMGPYEAKAWAGYHKGSITLPDINWETDIDSAPLSLRPLKIAGRRAEALNRLYQTDKAQPGHSVWFIKHHPVCLSLIKAMARVIGAERNLVGGGAWTATQLADLESINKVLDVTAQIVSGYASDPLLPLIARAQGILVSHRKTLRNLNFDHKRKRDISPEKEQCVVPKRLALEKVVEQEVKKEQMYESEDGQRLALRKVHTVDISYGEKYTVQSTDG